MEEKQNVEVAENQLDLKNLLINKTDDEDVASSSAKESQDAKKCEESENTANSSQKEEDRLKAKTPTPARTSPEPSCAICLEQLQNKSFTDSCFHMFCFTCLVEWSKVKPECPLCKQSFKSIVHNVRSFEDYDQYYIRSRSSESMMAFCGERRFHYRTTLTSERYRSLNAERMLDRSHIQYPNSFQSEIASHRMRYAPHSVQTYATSQTETHTTSYNFRRRIYAENLWVQPSNCGRVRCATPEFFRNNIACTHRLLPWLNRELLAVMQNNEGQVSFVVELIMALIIRFEIRSEEFFLHIDPYLAPHTNHFVHEFYHFAVSPYEMEFYDIYSHYNNQPSTVRLTSSPDSDVIPLPTNESTHRGCLFGRIPKNLSPKKKKHHSKSKAERHEHVKEVKRRREHLRELKRRLEKIVLKKRSDNCWENVGTRDFQLHLSDLENFNPFEIPGPSRETVIPECSNSSKQIEENKSNDALSDDDECQIVGYVKPRNERTPEIVDISSGEEPENIINVPSDDDVDDGLSSLLSSITPQVNARSDDDDCIFEKEVIVNVHVPVDIPIDSPRTYSPTSPIYSPRTYSPTSPIYSPIGPIGPIGPIRPIGPVGPIGPIDYSLKKPDVDSGHEDGGFGSSTSRDTTEYELQQFKKNSSIILSAVRTLTNEPEPGTSSWSPSTKSVKRKATFFDDSSTESCSESTQVTEIDSRVKKLKLRSVVAHFSYDRSDEHNDSSHRSSSHKKHKEKKKKKKKHKNKHKHRIYSSDSN